MAENVENAEREPDIAAVFDDSGDEGSFDGFEGGRRDYDSIISSLHTHYLIA